MEVEGLGNGGVQYWKLIIWFEQSSSMFLESEEGFRPIFARGEFFCGEIVFTEKVERASTHTGNLIFTSQSVKIIFFAQSGFTQFTFPAFRPSAIGPRRISQPSIRSPGGELFVYL